MESFLLYLLKSMGLIIVFFGFYYFLLKKDTTFYTNRKFLLGGLITAAVLPAVYFTRTIIIEASPTPYEFYEGNFTVVETAASTPAISWLKILFFSYLAGVAFMTARLLLQLGSLCRLLFSGSFSQGNGNRFIITDRAVAPFSFFHFIVYNPSLHSPAELDLILNHEKVHVSQWHSLDVILANLNLVYQWCNPIAWLYVRELQQNLEFIADQEAVKQTSCKKEYQKALLRISVENFNMALTNNFYQSLIKKRIIMLNKKTSGIHHTWKTALIFPVLMGFLLIFNVKTVAQEKENLQDTTVTPETEIRATINRNSTDEELDSLIEKFAEQNVQLDFEKVERNTEGTITSISVGFHNTTNNKSGKYTSNDPEGIEDFTLYLQGDGKMVVGTVNASAKTGETRRIIKVGDSASGENRKEFVFVASDTTKGQPVYVVNGEILGSSEANSIDPQEISSIIVLKGASATSLYGSSARDGAIVIQTKAGDSTQASSYSYVTPAKGRSLRFTRNAADRDTSGVRMTYRIDSSFTMRRGNRDIIAVQNGNSQVYFPSQDTKPLYVVNGEIMGEDFNVNSLNPQGIAQINVIKGEGAIEKYGEDARDGAIEIQTKDDLSALKKGTFAEVDASTTEEGLRIIRRKLEDEANLRVRFDNVKRNKEGLITRIKISGETGGSNASATFEVEEGIPPVTVGLLDDQIIISSSRHYRDLNSR